MAAVPWYQKVRPDANRMNRADRSEFDCVELEAMLNALGPPDRVTFYPDPSPLTTPTVAVVWERRQVPLPAAAAEEIVWSTCGAGWAGGGSGELVFTRLIALLRLTQHIQPGARNLPRPAGASTPNLPVQLKWLKTHRDWKWVRRPVGFGR